MKKRNFILRMGVMTGWLMFFFMLIFHTHPVIAQSGSCGPNTPFFLVDLSSSPGGTWVSPNVSRRDLCCGTTAPDRCIEFEIRLHPQTIAVNFEIASGAVPPGALFYQINCGPQIPVGQPICLNGPGPYTLTFCKPGNNPNTYAIRAIPSPQVSPPTIASQNCPAQLWVQGLNPNTIRWRDITSGTGIYDAFLSCTNCANPIVTPSLNPPPFVDYEVCGTVAAPNCAGVINFCDTVRVTMFQPLDATINPNPVVICQGTPGRLVNASATGGWGNLTYRWYNSSWNQVGTGTQWMATTAGNYYLVVSDEAPNCPDDTVPFTVQVLPPPTLTITPRMPGVCQGGSVVLRVTGASYYEWSPSTGLSQVIGSTVIASPSATTTYTVTGTDQNGCTNTTTVTVRIFPLPQVDAGPDQTICQGQSAQLQGSGAWLYNWRPAATLNNPNISNPIATPSVTTTYYLTGYSLGDNVIFNGDFEQGNVGFTTDYQYNINLIPEGNYYVTNNPRNTHPNFAQCQDHTPAPGNLMMVINGAPVANQRVWCQTVQVTPNTDYAFSTWVTSVHPLNPAVLQFYVNGSLLGTPFTASNVVCNWQQFYQIWNSGNNTSVEICIINQNTIRNGNDFALDDISFAPLCSNVDSVTVYVNPIPQINVPTVTICEGETAQLLANSNVPNTTFTWNTGYIGNPLSVSPPTTTNYTVTGTANNCSNTATGRVIVNPRPILSVNASQSVICAGSQVTLTASSNIAGTVFSWSTGNVGSSITVSPTTTTTYTVTGTTPNQCTSTAQITIIVNPVPNITLSSGSPVICQGQTTTISASSDIPVVYQWSTGQGNVNGIT
ncbi:MAG: hypothetical protein N2Z72_07430, partial [Bacteroidales bacterium]|nr:hypothetical protein [Bacteroidales bacterium]